MSNDMMCSTHGKLNCVECFPNRTEAVSTELVPPVPETNTTEMTDLQKVTPARMVEMPPEIPGIAGPKLEEMARFCVSEGIRFREITPESVMFALHQLAKEAATKRSKMGDMYQNEHRENQEWYKAAQEAFIVVRRESGKLKLIPGADRDIKSMLRKTWTKEQAEDLINTIRAYTLVDEK